jgi:hypothetical protein
MATKSQTREVSMGSEHDKAIREVESVVELGDCYGEAEVLVPIDALRLLLESVKPEETPTHE